MKTEPGNQIIKIKVGIPDTETGCEIKKDVVLCKITRKREKVKIELDILDKINEENKI